MKRMHMCFLLVPVFFVQTVDAQSMNGPPVSARNASAYQSIVNINGQDGFYLKKDLYLTDSYTIINGERVMGIPFLYIEWLGGSVVTPDGRVYTGYALKYNAENQTVFFLNGKDSLEVNEEIKEFTLSVHVNDTLFRTSRFINANQYQKGKPVFYYEVVLDNEKGQLLRTNQKVVTTDDKTLVSTSHKYLRLDRTYYYYDKQKKKLVKIKPGSDLRAILSLTEEQAKELQLNTIDLSREEDIIAVVKLYFEKYSLKAF